MGAARMLKMPVVTRGAIVWTIKCGDWKAGFAHGNMAGIRMRTGFGTDSRDMTPLIRFGHFHNQPFTLLAAR